MDENRFSSEEDGDVCCLDNVSAIYGGNLSEVDTPVILFKCHLQVYCSLPKEKPDMVKKDCISGLR